MKVLALIPARYASTRLPGKPLLMLGEKPIIQHVYERVTQVVPHTYVATDDERIRQCVEQFGGKALVTSPHHPSGTDRCWEAYQQLEELFDVILNVQGDEPFVNPQQLRALLDCFQKDSTEIATLIKPYPKGTTYEEMANPNRPKVIVAPDGRAIYFSRNIIPHLRSCPPQEWGQSDHTFYHHIGLYAYRPHILGQITALPPSPLEQAESLEQLRWIEAGLHIQTAITHIETIGIDTPDDLQKAHAFIV